MGTKRNGKKNGRFAMYSRGHYITNPNNAPFEGKSTRNDLKHYNVLLFDSPPKWVIS